MKTHGYKRPTQPTNPIYTAWNNMKRRCVDPNNHRFYRYGGRGIVVCKEWEKFENFLNDMGPTWVLGLTLERKDTNGHYCKENYVWATRVDQMNNTSRNHWIEYNGVKMTIAQWANACNIKYKILRDRICKLNWPIKKALETAPHSLRGRPERDVYTGRWMSKPRVTTS